MLLRLASLGRSRFWIEPAGDRGCGRTFKLRLIPMDTIPRHLDRLEELAESATLIVFCHHGVRSANVVHWLRGQGIAACQSMAGGIDRWSTEVDPTVPRY